MTSKITIDQVWDAIQNEVFCVLGMINQQNQARTVGVVYAVQDRKLYVGTGMDTWKTKHIQGNPSVSVTVPIPRRVPFLPWITIPQATITFSGTASITEAREVNYDLLQAVFRHKADDPAFLKETCVIEIIPHGEFVTYGVGVPLLKMRHPDQARGRAPAG